MKDSIFLGGTCGNNTWRDGTIMRLEARGIPRDAMFNPVVKEWNEVAMERENRVKRTARFILVFLGDPMQGCNSCSFYSLFETMVGLIDVPERMIVVFDVEGAKPEVRASVTQTYKELRARFPHLAIFSSLTDAEDYLVEEFKRYKAA